jgi:preprotein translocase subunit SecG
MSILYVLLSLLLCADCVILILLVLLQLPKKEAGAGMAFGGGATDALFGAGSGNVLTKITKYAAGIFFGLAIIMAMVASKQNQHSSADALKDALSKQTSGSVGSPVAPLVPPSAPAGNSALPLLTNLPAAQTAAPAGKTNPAATNK